MTYPLNSAGVPDLASAIAAAIPDAASIRIGKVTRYDAGYITVAISASDVLVDAAYLFGSYQPALGDNVVVLKQGNQWVVSGALSSNPDDNMVANYSFEDGEPGAFPPNWTLYHNPSSNEAADVDIISLDFGAELDGRQALSFTIPGGLPPGFAVSSSVDVVTSDPIAVTEGERWTASAWITGSSLSGPFCVRGTTTLSLTWYASDTAIYPNYLSESVIASSRIPVTTTWIYLRSSGASAGEEVPVGATHMRVTLDNLLTHEDCTGDYQMASYWDRVIARRLS